MQNDFNLDAWPRLSDALRIKARQLAERNLKAANAKPVRSNYHEHTISKFGDGFVRNVRRLVLLALMAAFMLSSVRLFSIGAETFGETLPDTLPNIVNLLLSLIAGACIVVLAETGQVIFSLAFATYEEHRWPLWFGLIISTLIALVGNFQVAIWDAEHITVFHVLEALAPPSLVMALAYVQKGQVLDDARLRHQNEKAYQDDLQRWEREFRNVEKHPEWTGFYARALRDTYARTYIKRLNAAPLTDDEWRLIVSRELQADHWHETLDVSQPVSKRVSVTHENGTRKRVSSKAHGVSGRGALTHYLEEHPDERERNRDDLAHMFSVSRSTVNRVLASTNGHGEYER